MHSFLSGRNFLLLIILTISNQLFTQEGPLSGTFIIGTGQTYETFTQAVDALKIKGVDGPVVFQVQDGTYEEQIIIPQITGASAVNTITFQSYNNDSTRVTLTYSGMSSNKNMILLDGADYITFRGMTIAFTDTVSNSIILLKNSANHNCFESNIIRGIKNSASKYALIQRYYYNYDQNDTTNEYNHFISNKIEYGYEGISWNSNEYNLYDLGNLFTDNVFEEQEYFSFSISRQDSLTIRKNTIISSNEKYSYGMSIWYCRNQIEIDNNFIKISSGYRGIALYYCISTNATQNFIRNNIVLINRIAEDDNNYITCGISLSSCTYFNIYNNTINLMGSEEERSYGLSANSPESTPNTINIINNIICNYKKGYAVVISKGADINTADYNDYYTNGNILAAWSETDYNSISLLTTATSKDIHSQANNPFFCSPDYYHVYNASLDNDGIYLSDVPTDIHGNPRNSHDIGAEEFTALNYDASIMSLISPGMPFYSGTTSVSVKLANCGEVDFNNVTIQWSVNDIRQTDYTYNNTIYTGYEITVGIGNYTFSRDIPYTIKIWSTSPNGQSDQNKANDTIIIKDLYTNMFGDYFIGGTSSTFPDFTRAVEALKERGIEGPVVFNVMDGLYTERIDISAIQGASAANTITFQSYYNDSTRVTLIAQELDYPYYAIGLYGARYIIFRKMTIRNGEDYWGSVILIGDSANYNVFESNIIQGFDESDYSSAYSIGPGVNPLVNFEASYPAKHNEFINNRFVHGTAGIYSYSWKGSTETNIQDNIFEDQYCSSVFIWGQQNLRIYRNLMKTTSDYSSFYHISLQNCSLNLNIEKNKLLITNDGRGIYLYNCTSSSSYWGLISNNFIRVGSGEQNNYYGYGIELNNSSYYRIYNNSILIGNDTSVNYGDALNAYNSPFLDIRNNIFATYNYGSCINQNSYTGTTIDYNNYFAIGEDPLYNQEMLDNLRYYSGQDQHSVSVDPHFISPEENDLHTYESWLNGKGISLSGIVSDDIDGDSRNMTTPDIGADEFDLISSDAGIARLASPSFPLKPGDNKLIVTLKNNGATNLTSVLIQWNLSNVYTGEKLWSGNLPSGDTIQVELATCNFIPNTPYTGKIWTRLPNTADDQFPVNDTLYIDTVYTALGDILTIGGTDPDYPDFESAASALTENGIYKSVTFHVREGIYYGPITIPDINGASKDHTITFESELGDSTAVIVKNPEDFAKHYIIELNGTDYVTFRAISVSIENTGSSSFTGLLMNGFAEHNNIESCVFQCLYPSGQNNYNTHIDNGAGQYNSFTNNRFEGGDQGIVNDDYYEPITSAPPSDPEIMISKAPGASSNPSLKGIDIRNNLFNNVEEGSIAINDMDSTIICNNIIKNSGGVSCNNSRNYLRIQQNIIKSIDLYSSLTISSYEGDSLSPGLIANNMIIGSSKGLTVYNCYNLKVIHNSVSVYGTSSESAAFEYKAYPYSNCRIFNNIFANNGNGYAVYIDLYSIESSILDYNDYFASGPILFHNYYQDYLDLKVWQDSSGMDAHSLSVYPEFVSDTSDLHAREILLNGGGIPMPEVTKDIDGEQRNTTQPDIGADEFSPIENDAQVLALLSPPEPFKKGTWPVRVRIKNQGLAPLGSVNVDWSVNDTLKQQYSWNGSLTPGDTTSIILGNYYFDLYPTYDIKAWSSLPNGEEDQKHENDTLLVTDINVSLADDYTIGGTKPDFKNFTEAAEALMYKGIAGNVHFTVRKGSYNEQVYISEIRGTSDTATISFASETTDSNAVIISYASDANKPYIIKLDGADHITLHKITVKAPATASGDIINIASGSDFNTISNCRLEAHSESNITNIISHTDSEGKNNKYLFNLIINGITGISINEQKSYNQNDSGTVIQGNVLENQKTRGISLTNTTLCIVQKNRITTNVGTGQFNGIDCYSNSYFLIDKNSIISNTCGYGINLYHYNSGSALIPGRICNNFVLIKTSNAGYTRGINIEQWSSYLNFYNNTICIDHDNVGSAGAICIITGQYINLSNNILVNKHSRALYVEQNVQIDTCDHNNYFTEDGTPLAYWLGYPMDNLDSLKRASGKDTNSLSVNPQFINDTNLHVKQPMLNAAGMVLAGIVDDIDGDPRDPLFPDIGADEFKVLNDDVGISAFISPNNECNPAAVPVTVRLENTGYLPQTGFVVTYILDGSLTGTDSIKTHNILPGEFLDYTFTHIPEVTPLVVHYIKAYTSLSDDEDRTNDTLYTSFSSYSVTEPVADMIPDNNYVFTSPNVYLSWSPSPEATSYDIYIWKEFSDKSKALIISNVHEFNISVNLAWGTNYNWQVVSKTDCYSVEGDEQSFSVQSLPDIIVDSIIPPDQITAGQQILLRWTVKNQGIGPANSTSWYDRVWLSRDIEVRAYEGEQGEKKDPDILLGEFLNVRSLDAGESYEQTATMQLPLGLDGAYYLFVIADDYDAFNFNIDTKTYSTHGGYNVDILSETVNHNNAEYVLTNIIVPKPPDLMVTELYVLPNDPISGNPITVTYTVKDTSATTTESMWNDSFYLSDTNAFKLNIPLGTITHYGQLAKDSSYTNIVQVLIPDGLSGTYYVVVYTDSHDDVDEHIYNDNNKRISNSINICGGAYYELMVISVAAPDSASNGETFNVEYTISNNGVTNSLVNQWKDRIGISSVANDVAANITWLKTIQHTGSVDHEQSYTGKTSMTLPKSVTGTIYVYIQTDFEDDVFELSGDTNHLNYDAVPVHVLTADLIPAGLFVAGEINSGDSITLNGFIKNMGLGAVLHSHIDRFYISSSAEFQLANALELSYTEDNRVIDRGDSIPFSVRLEIPEGYEGTYYLYMIVDDEDNVVEAGGETNNVSVALPIDVILSSWSDLVPEEITRKDTVASGDTVIISYQVRNNGIAETRKSNWWDYLYLSATAPFNPKESVYLGKFNNELPLPANSAYTGSIQAIIPFNLPSGVYHLFICVDAGNSLYENEGEENNIADSLIVCTGIPPADLTIENTSAPAETESGENVLVSWQIQNQSVNRVNQKSWFDAVYLSADELFDDEDILIGEKAVYGPLGSNEMYNDSLSVTIPDGIETGIYFLFVVADHKKWLTETDIENNVSNGIPLIITLSVSADLELSEFSCNEEIIAGQPIQIAWSVFNNGPGKTRRKEWKDQVYLSDDNMLDAGDALIGIFSHTGELLANTGYSELKSVIIPLKNENTGYHYLFIKTDAENREYEHNAEYNNNDSILINVLKASPADLIVYNVSAPATAITGDNVLVHWQIKNIGVNTASGFMKDLVYLSPDTLWNENDELLGQYSGNIQIIPGAIHERQLMVTIPGTVTDNYYIIIYTDAGSNINEDTDNNNTGASISPIQISVPELPLETIVNNTLVNEIPLYYQITIPSDLEGETVLITLNSDDVNAQNELYLLHGGIPSQALFELCHSSLSGGNQEIIIPSVLPGNYYLMVLGRSVQVPEQAIQLFAGVLDFTIRSVTTNQGGNTGDVTVKIVGSKFDDNTIVKLTNGDQTYIAKEMVSVNRATLFATFDLNHAVTGTYDVTLADNKGTTVSLPSGFKIVPGQTPTLLVNVEHPATARIGRVIAMTIEYLNIGNIDMDIPVRYVVSRDEAPIAFNQDELQFDQFSLQVKLKETECSMYVLRPGGGGSITIFTQTKRIDSLRYIMIE